MKKKALYVGWEESEPSDSDEEEHETDNLRMVDNNICFMAHEDEVISDFEATFTLEELEMLVLNWKKTSTN